MTLSPQTADDELDLSELVPDEACNHPDYCTSAGYWRWEQEIAQPIIEAKGYRVIGWRSTDADSLGPLVRAVDVERDGKISTYSYG